MANELQARLFEGAAVRIVEKDDGYLWFVATDVAAVLGYRDAANMVRLLDDDEKGTHEMSTLGGVQALSIISEPGLYKVIARSNKPGAKRFELLRKGLDAANAESKTAVQG